MIALTIARVTITLITTMMLVIVITADILRILEVIKDGQRNRGQLRTLELQTRNTESTEDPGLAGAPLSEHLQKLCLGVGLGLTLLLRCHITGVDIRTYQTPCTCRDDEWVSGW